MKRLLSFLKVSKKTISFGLAAGLLTSCSAKLQERSTSEGLQCQGRAELTIDQQGKREKANSSLLYQEVAEEAARLEWIFFSPIGTRIGRLVLEESGERFWQSPAGKEDLLKSQSPYAIWVKEDWPISVKEILGLLPETENSPFECTQGFDQRRCVFSNSNQRIEVNFSFLHCE